MASFSRCWSIGRRAVTSGLVRSTCRLSPDVARQTLQPWRLAAPTTFRCYTMKKRVMETSDLTGEEYAPNDVDYEDVVQGLQQEDVHIYIDVREFDEVKETGRIPHSKVVPLSELQTAFDLSDADFLAKYGFSKPQKSTDIVLYCRSGRRSRTAAKWMTAMGFSDVKRYAGSWLDWSARNTGGSDKSN
ncbi:putative thiosulfate sulfurtransferase, mitochondrial [Lamellibrachia satsuma]|nr:putative thiosulfate sulfurtransferase, mitochondrial [Lamellibrachia satsuma]